MHHPPYLLLLHHAVLLRLLGSHYVRILVTHRALPSILRQCHWSLHRGHIHLLTLLAALPCSLGCL